MIKLILFDMDNTLYPEKDYVLSGFQCVASFINKEYDIDESRVYNLLVHSFEQYGRGKNFDYLLRNLKISQKIKPKLIEIYRNHNPRILLRKDIEQFLKRLKANWKLCLITDGWLKVQKKKVSALGLDKEFDLILFSQSEGLEYAKPHYKFFKKAMDYFKVLPSECLMIGDDYEKDILGAKNISMNWFMVKNLLSKKEKEAIFSILSGEGYGIRNWQ